MEEEKKIGLVEHFFGKIGVAAIKLTDDSLQVGDTIRIKGHTTDLQMKVESIQIEHESVEKDDIGTSIGVKTPERVREHDIVYKMLP